MPFPQVRILPWMSRFVESFVFRTAYSRWYQQKDRNRSDKAIKKFPKKSRHREMMVKWFDIEVEVALVFCLPQPLANLLLSWLGEVHLRTLGCVSPTFSSQRTWAQHTGTMDCLE